MATMQTSFGTVSYTDEGSGPPIVLLHAALHDRSDFAPVIGALAMGRRVLALDWPGHGESPLPATPLRAVEFGDLLVEFADRLDLSNVVIVGNSVGGYSACRLALERQRARRGRRARQHRRLHAAQRFHSVLLRADGTSRSDQGGVPGFRACVHAGQEPDGQGRRRPRRGAGQNRRAARGPRRRCGRASPNPDTTCARAPLRSAHRC